jgi:hypothetical protein
VTIKYARRLPPEQHEGGVTSGRGEKRRVQTPKALFYLLSAVRPGRFEAVKTAFLRFIEKRPNFPIKRAYTLFRELPSRQVAFAQRTASAWIQRGRMTKCERSRELSCFSKAFLISLR